MYNRNTADKIRPHVVWLAIGPISAVFYSSPIGDTKMKLPYKSKTILFSLLAFVIAIAAYFGFDGFVMPEEIKEVYDLALPVAFFILRFVTEKKIGASKG